MRKCDSLGAIIVTIYHSLFLAPVIHISSNSLMYSLSFQDPQMSFPPQCQALVADLVISVRLGYGHGSL